MTMTETDNTATTTATACCIVTISYDELVSFAAATQEKCETGGRDSDAVVDSNCLASRKDDYDLLLDKIGQAFGSDESCLGILAATDIPDFVEQRQALLPLAALLPTLPDLEETCAVPSALYSVGWSHGKEELAAGKPDLTKGSFYANPWVDELSPSTSSASETDTEKERYPAWLYAPNVWPTASLPELKSAFQTLGQTIGRVGRLLAIVCDAYVSRQLGRPFSVLHDTLGTSLNSKARLLHYFPTSDPQIQTSSPASFDSEEPEMWCAWHNDHGSLTGLVSAMYWNVTTGEQVPCPDSAAGLYVQPRTTTASTAPCRVKVTLPPDACAFQIGETSQIVSGGILQATPHAVRAPAGSSITLSNISRETFAVFLEPDFSTPLDIPVEKSVEDCQQLAVQLPGTIKLLKDRWKPGDTFGDFHLATISSFART